MMKESNVVNGTTVYKEKQIPVAACLVQISLGRIVKEKTYLDITRLTLILHPTKFIVIVSLYKTRIAKSTSKVLRSLSMEAETC